MIQAISSSEILFWICVISFWIFRFFRSARRAQRIRSRAVTYTIPIPILKIWLTQFTVKRGQNWMTCLIDLIFRGIVELWVPVAETKLSISKVGQSLTHREIRGCRILLTDNPFAHPSVRHLWPATYIRPATKCMRQTKPSGNLTTFWRVLSPEGVPWVYTSLSVTPSRGLSAKCHESLHYVAIL